MEHPVPVTRVGDDALNGGTNLVEVSNTCSLRQFGVEYMKIRLGYKSKFNVMIQNH